MSLSLALNTARSSILTTSAQVEASARNIAGAGDPSTSRKIAVTTTSAAGGATVVQISRASDAALYTRMITATSRTAERQAVQDGLDRLQAAVGDPGGETAPAARLGALSDALVQYRNAPDEPAFGSALVTAAQDLTASLHASAEAVLTLRRDADQSMVRSVARVNDLLKQFGVENSAVIKGTAVGGDVTDALDRRDAIVSQISEEMGVSAVMRPGNDLVLYSDSGATLFETTARTVTFQSTPVFDAQTVGNGVFVDGVAVTGDAATMPLASGRLAGLTTLRDSVALTYQTQLDETARGLIASFAETSASAPTRPGLFTVGDADLAAEATPGLARRLAVAAAADPAKGGSPSLLRDGGINGSDYVVNASGDPGFPDRLQALSDALTAGRSFDAAGDIATSASLIEYSTASAGWLSAQRQAATTSAATEGALLSHASNALSNATGVNMDEEYAHQLELEHSFQASSKLMAIINQLFDSLLAAIR